MQKFLLAVFIMISQSLFSQVIHREIVPSMCANNTLEWTVDEIPPFDELVVSWNALRPDEGEYAVSVRVKIKEWSEDLSYAVWGKNGQGTFTSRANVLPVRTNEDTVELLDGAHATGFSVKIEGRNGAAVDKIWALHASMCEAASFKEMIAKDVSWKGKESVYVPVPGRSQIALSHPRHMDLCSPTSTSAVVGYLRGQVIGAPEFAAKVWDSGFDIYGNWIFSVAESAAVLGKSWSCYMARYDSFEQIYANLKRGIPTVVSVRGSIQGAIHNYSKGHLIAVIGYDAANDRIQCMDPGFPSDQETLMDYDTQDFLQACARRGYIGYFFTK